LVARVVGVAFGADDRVGAAADDLDDSMSLDVVVAVRDMDADYLSDTDVPQWLWRDDQEITGGEVGPHAVREHGLDAVEACARKDREQQERSEREAQRRAQRQVGKRNAFPACARAEPRVRARLNRCESHGYLLVEARCVPVNVYWIVDDLF